MDKEELAIIQELMDHLQEKMQYGEDDLAERLGRKKPGIEVVKVEGKLGDPMEKAEGAMGADLDQDQEMGESPDHADMAMGDGMDESPDEMLKRRLMKMRG